MEGRVRGTGQEAIHWVGEENWVLGDPRHSSRPHTLSKAREQGQLRTESALESYYEGAGAVAR